MSRRGARAGRVAVAVSSLLILAPPRLPAQFLRVGPFDLAVETTLEAVYSSNVEQEREEEPPAGVEKVDQSLADYFFVASVDLNSKAQMAPSTTLTLDSGLSVEKHAKREDLDNSSSPFGRLRLSSGTDWGHYRINAYGGMEREYEYEDESVYVPSKTQNRDVYNTYEYGGEVIWKRNRLELWGNYGMTVERHDTEEFQYGDNDEAETGLHGKWQATRRSGLAFDHDRTDTTYPNESDEDTWEMTDKASWFYQVFERPSLTYAFGYEKEETEEDPGEWDMMHTLAFQGGWDITPRTLRFSANASYDYEEDPEENDVSFVLGAQLDHEITRTAEEFLSVSHEPVDIMGSTADAENWTIHYNFTKRDLFVYNLNLAVDVTYTIDDPLGENEAVAPAAGEETGVGGARLAGADEDDEDDEDEEDGEEAVGGGGDEGAGEVSAVQDPGEAERKWVYQLSLIHSRAATRKLRRDISYEYYYESSNLEDDPIVEHRVTWSYTYTF